MDSNFEAQSPENADRKQSFRKPSNDKFNRMYGRHSSVSGQASPSPSPDGSPKHRRSPSPAFSREDPRRMSDVHAGRKSNGRESDAGAGRSRFDNGGDSHQHSDGQSYRSSHDYHKHGNYNRYHKQADEGEISFHRSYEYGREARSGTHADRTSHGSEHEKWGYRRNPDKCLKYQSDGEEHKGKDKDIEERKKHRDKDCTLERATSGKRHLSSYTDDSTHWDRDKHNKNGGGRDDTRRYGKSSNNHTSDIIFPFEEGTGHRRHSNEDKESGGSRMKETQKSIMKDLGRQKGDTIEKRKCDDKESDRHKERFSRETDGKDYSTLSNRKSFEGNEQYQDRPTRISQDDESSPKKFKLLNVGKDTSNGKDGEILSKHIVSSDEKPPSRSKLLQETSDKVISKSAQPSSNEAETSHDFDAAKVAALKAAELVNRNLIGGGYMSTDQKKKLLWGSKKSTAAVESGHCWDVPLFLDQERQEKFKKLMGVKGDLKPELKPDDKDTNGLLQAEKQEQLQMDLEKQYTAGLRRRDGRTVGLGL